MTDQHGMTPSLRLAHVDGMLDHCREHGTPIAVATFESVRNHLAAVVNEYNALLAEAEQPQDDRDAQLADLATELDAANDNAVEIADQRAKQREEIMRLRARVRELEGAQDERDGDVRAVAALLRLGDISLHGGWLTRWEDAKAELESRFADRIAALEARDAKAGEQR